MREKTLLGGALVATVLAASYGVYRGRAPDKLEIAPVALIDSSRTLASNEIPIRLTSSDGTGLKLVSMKAGAVVEDPLALTELHLVFENPEDRVLEGTFRITLPQGASLSRFAMRVGEKWQEGEVVELQKARQTYEDFLHRRQDPALLEQGGGNEFSARVFPIPARGKKEIIVAYSEVVEGGAPYVLALKGLPELGQLDIDVHAAGSKAGEAGKGGGGRTNETWSLHQSKITPAGDFVVDPKQMPRSAGLRAGDLAIARIVPFANSRPEPVGSAVLLVDTSASRALGLSEQARIVQRTLAKMPGDTQITVACFDQEVVQVYEGKASGFGEKETNAIIARGALGASDFEQAIAWAGEQAKKQKAKRVILVGDGVATAGETDAQKLKTKVEALRTSGVERMDAIAAGGIRDDAFLRTVVRGVLDKDGTVLDTKLGPEGLARRLAEATSSGVPVKIEGASWSWPRTLDGLQAGDEVMVFAQIEDGKPFRVDIGGQQFGPDLRTIDRPLVERAWAKAKIQSLIEAPTEDPATTKSQIIALSTKHRVLSPHTALLVLETDWDYRRYNIDRTANVDILTVRDGRVAVTANGRFEQDEKLKGKLTGKDIGIDGKPDTTTSGLSDKSKLEEEKPAEHSVRIAGGATGQGAGGGGNGGQYRWGPTDNSGSTRERGESARGGFDIPPPPDVAQRTVTTENGAAPTGGTPAPAAGRRGDGWSGENRDHGGTKSGGHVATGGDRDEETKKALEALQKSQLEGNQFDDQRGRGPTTSTPTTRQQPVTPPVARPPAATATAATPPPRPDPRDPLSNTVDGTLPRPSASAAPGFHARLAQARTGSVRFGALVMQGGMADGEAQRVLRSHTPALRTCYDNALQRNASVRGHMDVQVTVDPLGEVKVANITQSSTNDTQLDTCVTQQMKRWRFPAPGTQDARFTTGLDFVPDQGATNGTEEVAQTQPSTPAQQPAQALPYTGRFKIVMEHLAQGAKDAALDEANRWHGEQPGDIMALVALGEALEARGDIRTAARAYGSILELFSFRADSRRFAGERLERLKDPAALKLAIDSYTKAAEQRPDHPASHRLVAFTLLKAGEHEKAFEALKKGAQRRYPEGRFRGVDRILKEDLGLIAAAWSHAQPARTAEIRGKLRDAGGVEENGASLRFVLNWETDANDVDFHIYDSRGGHAFYSQMQLPSGGELYADVTTGYGPECFTIRGEAGRRAYPYKLQAHYYSRGPMGYGMGKLEIIDHDGKGNLTFDERPFVVMVDQAYVDLGGVDRSKGTVTASLK